MYIIPLLYFTYVPHQSSGLLYPQSKLLCLHTLVINSNQLSYLQLLLFQLPTSYPPSEIKDMIQV